MGNATRETTCGHLPCHAKALCRKCYLAAYYRANAERMQKQARDWRAANPGQAEALNRARIAADPEREREYQRAYSQANAEKKRQQARSWREANLEHAKRTAQRRYLANRETEKYQAGAAKRNAAAKRYYATHLEDRRAYAKAWRDSTREQRSEKLKEWRQANPEKVLENTRLRRARKRGANADLTLTQWRDILAEFDGHCAYCDRTDLPLVMEHMTPLSRGGAHTASNLVPACPPCNGSKHTKTALEFAGWEIPPRRQCA